MLVLAYMRLGGSVKNIAGHLHTLERSVISLDRIQQLLNIPTEAESALARNARDSAHEVARRDAAAAGAPAVDFGERVARDEAAENLDLSGLDSSSRSLSAAPKIDREALRRDIHNNTAKGGGGTGSSSTKVMPLAAGAGAAKENAGDGAADGAPMAGAGAGASSAILEDAIVLHRVRFVEKEVGAARDKGGAAGGVSVFTDVAALDRQEADEQGIEATSTLGRGAWQRRRPNRPGDRSVWAVTKRSSSSVCVDCRSSQVPRRSTRDDTIEDDPRHTRARPHPPPSLGKWDWARTPGDGYILVVKRRGPYVPRHL